MTKGLVSATLTPEALREINEAIGTIKRRLPFLLAVGPKQRLDVVKLGPKSVHFVNSVRQMADKSPELVPAAFDLVEFARDVEVVNAIGKFAPQLEQLVEAVKDTRTMAGSEAVITALRLYEVFKAARRTVPGLDGALAELGARFKGSRRRKAGGTGPA